MENPPPLDFSLFFFSGQQPAQYRLLQMAAEFADRHRFKAIWIPERHFHPFGGIFPNPSVLAAAVAVKTQHIRIRAGSVVLPLHDPVRVVEEWSVVDHLSQGRVDLALAAGWNPDDFIFAAERYPQRYEDYDNKLDQVLQLWQGHSVERCNGNGETVSVRTQPPPVQPRLTVWSTCSGSHDRFVDAGRKGHNVLTALLFQTPAELASKIQAYREAREEAGFDPHAGQITVMLHTFICGSNSEAREMVRAPFLEYLKSSTSLWKRGVAGPRTGDRLHTRLNHMEDHARERALNLSFVRYFETSALFGDLQKTHRLVTELQQAGATEIGCLIDFGIPDQVVLDHLIYISRLKDLAAGLVPG